MWKAFDELAQLDWLQTGRRPRMYACQSDGCAPIVNAFEAGQRFAEAPPAPHTIASHALPVGRTRGATYC